MLKASIKRHYLKCITAVRRSRPFSYQPSKVPDPSAIPRLTGYEKVRVVVRDYLPSGSFTFDPLFHAGLYYVQEASGMFLEQALRQAVMCRNRCGCWIMRCPGR